MKITKVDFNPVKYDSLVAFASVTFDDSITVKGFKIVEGDDGYFVGMPSEKGKDGKYYPTVLVSKKAYKSFQETVLSYYDEFEDKGSKKKKRRDDDDDEKPRKSRRNDDDDEDERPKKSRRNDDDDDDEKPKKKRRDDDDDDDETDFWGKSKK